MYTHELASRISSLEKKIKNRDEYISQLIKKNNEEKQKLSKMKLSLESKISEQELCRAKLRPKSPKGGANKKRFISLDDCENAGLFNKVVLFPIAKCNLHNCFLDYGDVRKRNCVMRMCKHMEWVNETQISQL